MTKISGWTDRGRLKRANCTPRQTYHGALPANGTMLPDMQLPRAIRGMLPSFEPWERTAWIASVTQFFTLIGFGLGLPFLPMYVQFLGIEERPQVALWSGVLAGTAALSMAV